MKQLLTFIALFFICLTVFPQGSTEQQPVFSTDEVDTLEMTLDVSTLGREFEGFGSLSAGASSRLLYDYPEPYRSDILDYLFKPNFGANIHHLKVEIGGDINSTDGSEPSIASTREEFENPKEGYFRRGYEYWLMLEAKKRNPNIILEGLQWGAPGWIGDGEFFSKDNAEFVSAWVRGAKEYWDLDIDYVGIRNERHYDIEYIKLMRKTLDENGLEDVKIVAGDLWKLHEKWEIAEDILKDPELAKAVGTINSHTSEELNYYTPQSVKETGKPVWAGESHFHGEPWYAAASWARAYRSYANGKITKVINWSLISSYHDFLVAPGSGLMKANTPWSGFYEVHPSIWALAHINQFAKPGWKYIESGTKWWGKEGSLREGLSMTTLMDTISKDYSVIIETMDAMEPQLLVVTVPEELSDNDLNLFRSVFKKEEFVQQENVELIEGKFSIKVEPNSIYSLSTTRGQKKGVPANAVPKDTPFLPPYINDFEDQELHSPGRFFSDQNGNFEVYPRQDGKGNMLRQVSEEKGMCWRCDWTYPGTFVGDISWTDYKASLDFKLPDSGSVLVAVRASGNPFTGYRWTIQKDGKWELHVGKDKLLASGKVDELEDDWHSVEITVEGNQIKVILDKKKLVKVKDSTVKSGVLEIGTGYNVGYFDSIVVRSVK